MENPYPHMPFFIQPHHIATVRWASNHSPCEHVIVCLKGPGYEKVFGKYHLNDFERELRRLGFRRYRMTNGPGRTRYEVKYIKLPPREFGGKVNDLDWFLDWLQRYDDKGCVDWNTVC
jgi:hypothetical protein